MKGDRKQRSPLLWAFVGLVVTAAGCATQSDLQYARRDVQQTRSTVADLHAKITAIQSEVAELRGQVEEVRFRAGSGSDREQLFERLESLEARLTMLEEAGPAPTFSDGTVTDPGVVGAEEPTAPPPSGATEIAAPAGAPPAFREGVDLLRSGKGKESIQKFRDFLRHSPRSELADDAQFWIGEAYLSVRDYNRAILEFNEVLLRYPKGDRVPRALLRQATAFEELGDRVDARLVLQKLVSEHGSSREAEIAREKLAELGS